MPSCSEPPVPSRPTSLRSRGSLAGHVEAANRFREVTVGMENRPEGGEISSGGLHGAMCKTRTRRRVRVARDHLDSAHRTVPRAKG